MATLEGLWIKNFKIHRNTAIGSAFPQSAAVVGEDSVADYYNLTPTSVIIGRNRTGITSLFEAIDFLIDCFRFGLEESCNMRGGFEAIVTRGEIDKPISFGFNFRVPFVHFPVGYVVSFALKNGRPLIANELLALKLPPEEPFRQPYFYIDNGVKQVRYVQTSGRVASDTSWLNQINARQLTLPRLIDAMAFPVPSQLVSYFVNAQIGTIINDLGRGRVALGHERYRLPKRETISAILKHLETEHREILRNALRQMALNLPGIEGIECTKDRNGRISLLFKELKTIVPCSSYFAGESLLKMAGICLMLEDPSPPSLLCADEIENGLSMSSLRQLFRVFKQEKKTNSSQILIGTHLPFVADAAQPTDVWMLDLDNEGFSVARKALDDPAFFDFSQDGTPASDFWFTETMGKGLTDMF